MIGNFLLANSVFFTEFGLGGSNGLNSDNQIDDATVAANFSWFKSSSSTIKFGTQIKNLGFLYTNSFNDSLQFEINTTPKEYASYAKLKYSPSEKLILEPGVRVNLYSVYSDSIFPDLRFGMKYLLTDDRYINFSVGNYLSLIHI